MSGPDALVRWLLTQEPRLGSTGRLLAVDGPAGAGKTTYAAAIAAGAPGTVRVLHLDDMYEGWNGLGDVAARVRDNLLLPLSAGRAGGYRRWDWVDDGWAEWVPVEPVDLLVLEGVGSGSLEIAPYLSGLVWVDASYPVRMERGLARDGAAFAPQWRAWAEAEQDHFAEHGTELRADLRVTTG
ncbi:MAG: 4-amino-4-deoxy-L-arabinose transferase [Nocardioides sp.]